MRILSCSLVAVPALFLLASEALAQGPAPAPGDACHAIGSDDTLRPIPSSLVPAATALFDLHAMPSEQIMRSTFFRCAGGHVLICTVGANLPCGKANKNRHLPAADQWCADHRDANFLPAYVTGHDTIYQWRCSGTKADTVGNAMKVDARGFIARFWKRVAR